MKTKLKIGDKVRVINKERLSFNNIGTIIEKASFVFDWVVDFGNGGGEYRTSELQLIKPVRKWKYSRQTIADKLRVIRIGTKIGKIDRKIVLHDLLAKSEHTEDKSDKLSTGKEIIIGWDVGNDKDQSCIVYGIVKDGEIKVTMLHF